MKIRYSVREKHLETLESLDLMLLRKVFKAHSKTAAEAFFLESGIVPIRFTLAKRKLMYLRTILMRPKDDLVRKVYKMQKTVKTPGDWALSVEEDRSSYEINLTDEQIEETSKYKFENTVKRKVNPIYIFIL